VSAIRAAPTEKYAWPLQLIHWTVAFFVACQLMIGVVLNQLRSLEFGQLLLGVHRQLGLAIFAAMLIRVVIGRRHGAPPLGATLPTWQRLLAAIVHRALYALLAVQSLMGLCVAWARGDTVTAFGLLILPPPWDISDDARDRFVQAHTVMAALLLFLILLHIGAVIFNSWARRVAVLERIVPSSRANRLVNRVPIGIQLGLAFGLVILLAAGIGVNAVAQYRDVERRTAAYQDNDAVAVDETRAAQVSWKELIAVSNAPRSSESDKRMIELALLTGETLDSAAQRTSDDLHAARLHLAAEARSAAVDRGGFGGDRLHDIDAQLEALADAQSAAAFQANTHRAQLVAHEHDLIVLTLAPLALLATVLALLLAGSITGASRRMSLLIDGIETDTRNTPIEVHGQGEFAVLLRRMVAMRRTIEQRAQRASDERLALEADRTRFAEQLVAERTAELRESGEKYRTLIENTGAVPWELDRTTWRATYLAPQFWTTFGVERKAGAMPPAFLDFLHPEDRGPFKEFLTKASLGLGGANHIDSRIATRDRGVRHLRTFVPAQAQAGESTAICGLSIDITQQKILELELAQAQKLEAIGQLSAGIAHEINTPTQFIGDNIRFLQESVGDVLGVIERLTPLVVTQGAMVPAGEIVALLETVDLEYLREEVPKAIAQSLEGIDRISNIVGAMKDFSHPALDMAPHDLNRAITSTITVATNEWRYVAEVKTSFDADLPLVPVMLGAFNQVILNILVNAAHAVGAVVAETPGTKGLITVSTRQMSKWAEIRIQDTGCGISEEVRGRIFDPFFTTKPIGKGTGQGLTIAHDVVVKKHGGTISVDSEPGVGTTFTLRFPLETLPRAAILAA